MKDLNWNEEIVNIEKQFNAVKEALEANQTQQKQFLSEINRLQGEHRCIKRLMKLEVKEQKKNCPAEPVLKKENEGAVIQIKSNVPDERVDATKKHNEDKTVLIDQMKMQKKYDGNVSKQVIRKV